MSLLIIYKLRAFLVRVDLNWFKLAGLELYEYEPGQICIRTINGLSSKKGVRQHREEVQRQQVRQVFYLLEPASLYGLRTVLQP